MTEPKFLLQDHVLFTWRGKKVHAVIRQITGQQVYLQNYSSEKFYSAKLSQLEPFTVEEAQRIQIRKTKTFCEQIKSGKVLKTAGKEYQWMEGRLVELSTHEPASTPELRTIELQVSPFLFDPDDPPTVQVKPLDGEFNYCVQGCFGSYGTICNNRTQIIMAQKDGQALLKASKAIGKPQKELSTFSDVITEKMEFYYRMWLLGACESVQLEKVFAQFLNYVGEVLVDDEKKVLHLLQDDVQSMFVDASALTSAHLVHYAVNRCALEVPFQQRCMLIVLFDWLEQNLEQFFRVKS